MAKAKTPESSRNITVVLGSDEGAVKTAARELAERLAPADAGEFGVEVIDGAADNAAIGAARLHETIAALQDAALLWRQARLAQERKRAGG